MLAIALPVFVVAFVGVWAGTADAGERCGGDLWNWHYLYGSSEPVTIQGQQSAYLPLVSRSCAFDLHAVELLPTSPGPHDPRTGFTFGASIRYTADCETLAKVTAFCAYPGETIPGCRESQILPDRPFVMEQESYLPGEHVFSREYRYTTYLDPRFDRLVVRVQVRGPWPRERLLYSEQLYCEQEEYALTPYAESAPSIRERGSDQDPVWGSISLR
jgi:hypothetical protein